MTSTDKAVRRVTRDEYRVLFPHAKKGRRIVVEMAGGDILIFREHGCRERWTLPIESAFRHAVKIRAFAELMEDGKDRKARGLKSRRHRKGLLS